MIDRWRVAIREAGHAVVGRVLELPCGCAGISPDGSPVSFHAVDKVGDHEHETGYRGRQLAMLAGEAAEVALIGSSDVFDDCRWVAAILELPADTAAEERAELADCLQRTAAGLVLRHVGKIDRLARELWCRGELTNDAEIRAIASLPYPDAWWLGMIHAEGRA